MIRKVQLSLPTIVCLLALPLCAVLIHPWAEVGINGDWSYNYTAKVLAATGHIHYNGWATAMLGWQLYFGAALIKVFGFSFTITRVGTLLIAMFTAALTQQLLVRLGVTAYNSVVATLVLVLSPVFLQMTFSYMSDIYGMFVLIGCCYCCVRALQAEDQRAAAAWVCVAALSNALGGTTRQIAWLGLAVMVPCTIWLLRRNRRVLWLGGISTLCGAVFVAAALHWYSHQPLVIVEPVRLRHTGTLKMLVLHMVPLFGLASLCELLFLIMPVALLFTPLVFRSRRTASVLALVALPAAAVAIALQKMHKLLKLWKFCYPYMPSSIWYKTSYRHVGSDPFFVTPSVRVLLTAISLWGGLALLCALLAKNWTGNSVSAETSETGPLRLGDLTLLLVPFLAAYLALVLMRFLSGGVFDRYYLFPEFIALVFVTLLYQQKLQPRYHTIVWGLLAIPALCDIAGMHDFFTQLSAQVALEQELTTRGVPRTAIDGGLEYDAWLEIERTGHVNDPRIINTPDAYRNVPLPRDSCSALPWVLAPSLEAQYVISLLPTACRGPSQFKPVVYHTFFAPQTQRLYAVRGPYSK